MRALLALTIALLLVLLWLGYGGRNDPPEPLTGVYSPAIDAVPPAAPLTDAVRQLRADLLAAPGQQFLRRVVPDQAGVLWLTLVLALAVAVDFTRLRNPHNVDLALLLAPGVVFFNVMGFISVIRQPVYLELLDIVFSLVVVITSALVVRALWRAVKPIGWTWQPNLPLRALAALTAVLLACNMMAALVRVPDDAGYFVNLGAQRLRERGRLPYGDPLLTGTPGAAYGPVLYVAHVPFQWIVAPRQMNAHSTSRPPLTPESPYFLPPALATKLCTIFFQLVAVASLLAAGTRLGGRRQVGWAMAALYCGSPYVLGVGGDEFFIGGMTFVSHIAPAAITFAAFALLPSPAWAGALLAIAGGAGFYPLFMFPAWMAHWWNDWGRMRRFFAGFALAAAVIAVGTWIGSRPVEGQTRLGTIMSDTLGHHTDPRGYGSSPFGFWGQRGGIRAWMIAPLVGESGLTSPVYLILFGLVGVGVLVARNGSERALALASAAIAAAFSLAKIHPTGSYVTWCYGFLLLGLLAADAGTGVPDSQAADRREIQPEYRG
jgi:hypothetical protein